ncbi:MAG: outer membrane lipid asymmetry maintenance protein MlaD [Pseudomonadota bacterium]
MSNSATETIIGAVVLATAAGFLVYSAQSIGVRGASGGQYDLRAAFASAEGLNVGTEVRMAGVRIGTVTDMGLDAATYQAVTTLAIDTSIRIPDDSDVKVASEGLLGGTFVEIAPGGSPDMMAEGDEFIYTQGSVDLINLMLKFATGGQGE